MKEERIVSLTDAVLTLDGTALAVTLMGMRGPLLRVRLPLDEAAALVTALCAAVKTVHPADRPAPQWPLIEASGAGLADSGDPTTVALVMRLAGLDLAFAIPNTAVGDLAGSFAQKALALSAHGPMH